ncbi:MAG TPA: o-succinylbenzoate synthase [Vicinamibacteria bacterium]|nr:o-succinylbenzoate synthase [Vicinamibacteria bacterium]
MGAVPAASNIADLATPAPLGIDALEIRLVRLPLAEPFETSFGRVSSRLVFLVRLTAGDACGWGEVVAFESPSYGYETVGTARHVIRDYFAPALMGAPVESLAGLVRRFAPFRGHPMARAGIELAYADLVARLRGMPLARLLGGTRERIAVGVSLGIQKDLPSLLDRVERHLALGYQRIKLKIKPGWDVDVVREVRRRHPEAVLSVDANGAYALADRDHLARLDAFGLLMIEQPLEFDDIVDHAELQRHLTTPLCLDESLTGLQRVRQALALASCRIVNMKVGRVGGYSQALPIHELCRSRGAPLWCGGMLESGVGRAHNIALASLAGFTLPGDISSSRRYFARDVIVPEVEVRADGTVEVPRGPGLGYEVDPVFLAERTEALERFTA